MSFSLAFEAIEKSKSDRPIAHVAKAALQAHNTATVAALDLRVVAERYYTTAGFRE